MASDTSIDTSVYSQITDTEERMLIFNNYVTGSIGMTLSALLLYSYMQIHLKTGSNSHTATENKYFGHAIKCGASVAIGSFLYYFINLFLCNDLVLPMDFKNNFDIVSILDSFLVIICAGTKVSFYYGFTFIYLSLFKKEKIDKLLVVIMVFTLIAAFTCSVLYTMGDIMVQSVKEISITETRGIMMVTTINSEMSDIVASSIIIAFLADIIFISVLLYRFISAAKHAQSVIKGVVLFSISSIVWFVYLFSLFNVLDADFKYLIDSVWMVVDSVWMVIDSVLFSLFNF
eukprot:67945_1